MEKAIEVRNLTKYYGKIRGIEDISFDVYEGEVVGLLGPNGAGKTTTLNIITGALSATSGEVRIAGYDIFEEPILAKAQIGYLPEYPPVYIDMTVEEYLRYTAALKNVSKDDVDDRVSYSIEKCGLEDVRNKLIGNLSKGYQQRVGIAQSIIHDPKILILDEPTIGLDPKQIVEIRNLIKEIGKERTIIFSSHILPEVSQICSRIIIISDGRIVADDTQENLSKRLKETNTVLVRFSDVSQEIIRKLRTTSGIKDVNLKEDGGIIIEAEKDADVIPLVNDFVCKENLIIRELVPIDLTLEDVFIKLVTREGI